MEAQVIVVVALASRQRHKKRNIKARLERGTGMLGPFLAGLLLFPLLPILGIEVEWLPRRCLSLAAGHFFLE